MALPETQGRLTVVAADTDTEGRRFVLVQCRCGVRKTLFYANFKKNKVQSCGCLAVERSVAASTVHGFCSKKEAAKPEYEAWRSMIQRCETPTTASYAYYGGAGISVCAEWRASFVAFLESVGLRPSPDHVLCLLDKKKDFAPGNASWTPRAAAIRTKRSATMYTVDDVKKCLADWATESGIAKTTLHYRVVTRGMSMKEAIKLGSGRSGKALPS